jgi:hypothetical protein
MEHKMNMPLNLALTALPLLLLPACCAPCYETNPVYATSIQVSPPPPHPLPPTPPAVWQPAQVTAYSVGRVVDPRDPDVVHEAHTLYRRVETSRPNLAPPLANVTSPGAPAAGPTATPVGGLTTANINTLLHDALTAELNQQRATSLAIIQQARALDERLREFNRRSEELRSSIQDSAGRRAQPPTAANRPEVSDTQLNPGAAVPAGQTPTNRSESRP